MVDMPMPPQEKRTSCAPEANEVEVAGCAKPKCLRQEAVEVEVAETAVQAAQPLDGPADQELQQPPQQCTRSNISRGVWQNIDALA